VGAVATVVAIVGSFVLLQGAPERAEPLQAAALGDLEMLLDEEELEMIEELEFYAWLEEQPEFDSAPEDAADDGVG
jgi:hypothetical protein